MKENKVVSVSKDALIGVGVVNMGIHSRITRQEAVLF